MSNNHVGGGEMKIVIAGGTGFIGSSLSKKLVEKGHEVIILTRKEGTSAGQIHYIKWTGKSLPAIDHVDIIINLAGESLNRKRWTTKQKEIIQSSRIETTEGIVTSLEKMEKKPKALINASAIGIYGTSHSETFTESSPSGNDFLASTVRKWEEAAQKARNFGIRTVFCRFGVVIDKHGGALPKMALPYHFFVGGPIASGKQWVSWIHIDDVVNGLIFLIENNHLDGPVNFTAPHPVQMNEFGAILGKTLNRPHWFPVPSFILKTVIGEMSMLVTEGQKVLPEKLLKNGFLFQYKSLEEALQEIYSNFG